MTNVGSNDLMVTFSIVCQYSSILTFIRIDMHHGFAGAGADFSNELNVKRVQEVIQLIVNFMSDVL